MKLNTGAFAVAQAVAAAFLFLVCGIFVGFFPEASVNFTKFAFHTDLSGIMRPLNISGFIVGLLVISIGFGLLSFVAAGVYDRLAQSSAR